MITKYQTLFTEDLANKKIFVTRDFDGSIQTIWNAWTQSDILDQWWAPMPWKAETKSMDFREGGSWLYAMVGPDGTKHWATAEYQSIDELKGFSAQDSFCDENGVKNHDMPSMHWSLRFKPTSEGTRVEIEIKFDSEEDLKKIIETGFKEGFTMAHDNLDELLSRS